MVKLYDGGVYLVGGRKIAADAAEAARFAGHPVEKDEAVKGTIAYGILKAHNKSGDMDHQQMRLTA